MSSLRVLLPLDGSALSDAIIPYVRHAFSGAHVTLLSVAPVDTHLQARHHLAIVAAKLREAGIADVHTVVRGGNPADEIGVAARAAEATLIALATHGRSGFDRLVLGSVAEKVIRASAIPVLALRSAEHPPANPAPRLLERVLLAYDRSEASLRSLDALAGIDAARRARIEIFTVLPVIEGGIVLPGTAAERRALFAESDRLTREAARSDAARALDRARELGYEAHFEVESDVANPAERILERAIKTDATLIAMTTHGRSGLARWALGSVTELVLRAATVPMLIAR
jgi:nucleotide-binding universal stress UspA family protein